MVTQRLRLMIAALVCLLLLLSAACGSPSVESAPLAGSTPVPTQPDEPPVPTVLPPEAISSEAAPPVSAPPVPSSQPTPSPQPTPPPDEETTLVYTVEGEELTVPALLHHAASGSALVCDTTLFACSTFSGSGGEVYWHSDDNYLTVTPVYGLPLSDVLDGLRLQENIAMEPELVTLGRDLLPACTLYLTAPNGLYRQFWVSEQESFILLVEISYDTVCDDAALLRASLFAMLDTLYLY